MSQVAPIPDGFHTLTPHLVVKNAPEAIEFYKKAFGALELFRLPTPDGDLIMHAELQIGDSRLMLCDEMPGIGGVSSPDSLEGSTITVHIWSEDADADFARALEAGAEVELPLMDAFWGDRYGKVKDPFGHHWSIATHIKDMMPAEIAQAAAQEFATNQDI